MEINNNNIIIILIGFYRLRGGRVIPGGSGANDRRARPNSRFGPMYRVSDSRAGHGDCQNQNKVGIIILKYNG